MIELVVFCGVVFGIAWGAGFAHLSFGIRQRIARVSPFVVIGLECLGCSSFHLGWIAFALHLTPPELHSWWQAAFFASASSLVLGKVSGLVNDA